MKVEAVIFDMDGLIFDTERIYYKAWQEAAKAYGYIITWEIYTKIVARNSRYIEKVLKQILGEDLPYDAIVKEKRRLADQCIKEEGIVVKSGLYELLELLDQQGIKKAVATSSEGEKAKRYLKLGKLEGRFDTIMCGDDVVESKPNPEIFLKAAERLGCKPENCVVLEDSRLGLEAGRKGGMHTIMVPDLVAPDEEIRSNADEIMTSLLEVRDWILAQ